MVGGRASHPAWAAFVTATHAIESHSLPASDVTAGRQAGPREGRAGREAGPWKGRGARQAEEGKLRRERRNNGARRAGRESAVGYFSIKIS